MTNDQRAMQVWSVLVTAARNQKILSYGMLERIIGVPQYGIAPILGAVHEHCKREKFPPLTAIVVNEPTGLPGHLYPEHKDTEGLEVLRDQARVFVFDWLKGKSPSEENFKAKSPKA